MLRKMKLFATGGVNANTAGGDWQAGSGVVGAGDVWTALTNGGSQPALPGSGTATDGELYLQGQGSDVTDEIIIGFKTYRNAGNTVYGIMSAGYSAFDDTLTFTTMPGASTPAYSAWSITSFTAYFWVNSRRIIVAARIGTSDILIHSGFVLQYGTRSQYPYPLLVSGTTQDDTYNLGQNNFGQSSLPDPCPNGAWLRWVDGSWKKIQHFSNNSATRSTARSSGSEFAVWPQVDVSVSDNAEVSTSYSEDNLFEGFSSTGAQISSAEIGVYALFPCLVHSASQLAAQLDGIYVVPGLGLTAGDTITVGGTTYDVFHNTYRSEAADFIAVKRA